MKIDNLDDLHVMLAAAQTGSFTRAGHRCGLSTAGVSAAIKRLETSLGVRLFERTTRSVRPTAEGEVMIDHARRALDLVAEGQARVRTSCNEMSGPVRISAASSMSQMVLAPWLAGFAAQHPGLEVDLQVSDALVDLVRDGIDMALRNGPLPDSTLVARLLVTTHRVACASPDYLARHGTPQLPRELPAHNCITYNVRGRRLSAWPFTPTDGGPQEVWEVSGLLASNNAAIAHLWARQGRGISYLSELVISETLASGELVRLFPGHLGAPVPMYAVWPCNRYVHARVARLIDALASFLSQQEGGLSPGSATGRPRRGAAAAARR